MEFEMERKTQVIAFFLVLFRFAAFDGANFCDFIYVSDAFVFEVGNEEMQVMQSNGGGEVRASVIKVGFPFFKAFVIVSSRTWIDQTN